MEVLIGFVAGYVLGTRAGKERYAELAEAWHTIYTSETVRSMLSAGSGMVATGAKSLLASPGNGRKRLRAVS